MAGAQFDFPNQQVVRADGSGPGIATVAPVLTSLVPTTAVVGSSNLTLQCNGTGMLSGSVVAFNGVDQPTTYVSPTQVTAPVKPAGATAGTVNVTVRNGNEPSNDRPFTFTVAEEPETTSAEETANE